MKMRLQAQAAQEATQNDSSERSNDDIEVPRFFSFIAYADLVPRK